MSSTWFGAAERASATAASWASSYIAIALSFLITPPVVEAGGENGDGIKSLLLVSTLSSRPRLSLLSPILLTYGCIFA